VSKTSAPGLSRITALLEQLPPAAADSDAVAEALLVVWPALVAAVAAHTAAATPPRRAGHRSRPAAGHRRARSGR
jgi:hypothetical protein